MPDANDPQAQHDFQIDTVLYVIQSFGSVSLAA